MRIFSVLFCTLFALLFQSFAHAEDSVCNCTCPGGGVAAGDGNPVVGIQPVSDYCDLSTVSLFTANNVSDITQTSSEMALLKNPNLLPKDRFVLTWQSSQDGSGLGVFAKLFDVDSSSGSVTAFTDQFMVNTITLYDQKSPQVAALDDGGFIITYASSVVVLNSSIQRQQRVLMQIFDRNGNAIGPESPVSDETVDRFDQSPTVSSIDDDNPGFAIGWISSLYTPSGALGAARAMVRIFSTDGSPRIDSFQANTLGDTPQTGPSLSGLADGSFVYTWYTQTSACQTLSLNSQHFDPLGNPLGPQFQVNNYTSTDSTEPAVAGLIDGSFVVTWSGNDANAIPDIYLQMYDSQFTRIGGNVRVNDYTTNVQSGSYIIARPTGGFLILWNSFGQDGSDFGVFGRFFNATGGKEGDTEFQVNPTNDGAQTLPSAVILPGNKVIATWTNNSLSISGRVLQCQQDCVTGNWSSWSDCSVDCGGGVQNRTRAIIFPPSLDGAACGSLVEQRQCNSQTCPNPVCQTCYEGSCYLDITTLLTYQDAITACHDLACPDETNCLVNVDSDDEQSYLVSNVITAESWIESWQGNTYGSVCLTMSQYGAITIPVGGCNSTQAAICEIPKPSSCA